MTNSQSNCLYPSALLQRSWRAALLLVLASFLTLTTSCRYDDDKCCEPTLKGKIISYNEFGAAMLDFTEADMMKAGFTLGDIISITVDDNEIVMPYYDGYYTRNGEYLCVAYPTYPIDVQNALSMKYNNEREEYLCSDAEFANARAASGGNLASGRLYRSSSPFCNEINRAFYVSEYLEREKVKTVLNLADTEEKMLSYDMPPYSHKLWEEGNVILCPLKADPTADDYNNRLIAALKELPSRPAPYVVHCMEGKDRTGYVCALLEGLCGATYEEIVADYLITYYNYYLINPVNDRDLCNALVSLRLNTCLMHYSGVYEEAELPKVNYAKAFSNYLLSHGMSQPQLDALVQALTVPNL